MPTTVRKVWLSQRGLSRAQPETLPHAWNCSDILWTNGRATGAKPGDQIPLGRKDIHGGVSPPRGAEDTPDANPEPEQKHPTQHLEGVRNQFLMLFSQDRLHGSMDGQGQEGQWGAPWSVQGCLLFGTTPFP